MTSGDGAIYENDVRYVPVKTAAKNVDLVPDYVSRMCRSSLVRGIRHAGIWYVEEESLLQFVKNQAAEYEKFKQRKSIAGKRTLHQSSLPMVRAETYPAIATGVGLLVLPILAFIFFPTSAPTSQEVAAAASSSFVGTIASAFYNAVCPIFNSCPKPEAPALAVTPTPSPAPIAIISAPAPIPRATPTPSPSPVQNITYPIRERVVERIVSPQTPAVFSGVTLSKLSELEVRLNAKIASTSVAFSPDTARIYSLLSAPNAGGGGGSTVTNVTNVSGVDDFNELSDVPSSLSAGDILYADASDQLAALPVSTNGLVLKLVGGFPSWAPDVSGGGGAGAWATSTNDMFLYPADPSDVVVVGNIATTTTGNILEVAGSSLFRGAIVTYNAITAPHFIATSTTASQFPYASTTALSATSLCLGSDCRSAWPAGDGDFSTSSADYLATQRSFFSTTSSTYFLSIVDKGYFYSTTSADYWKTANNFFSTSSASFWASGQNFFSTTSADYLASQRNFFSTTSADFFASSRNFFSTTSANYWKSLTDLFSTTSANYLLAQTDKGFFFSTTSASYFLAQQNVSGFSTTSADYWQGQRNFFSTSSVGYWKSVTDLFSTTSADYHLAQTDKGFFFSTTSADAWKVTRNFFSTTSADYWKTANNFFSTTSVDYWRSITDLFSTTSANYFAASSSTIPKTYTNNTFTGTQSFSLLNASSATTTALAVTNLANGSLLKVVNGGSLTAAVAGTDYLASTFAYLFPSNSTSTILNFNAGLTAYASSTIGNGGAVGLTINGNSTTTGDAYFAGSVGIGTTTPGARLTVVNSLNVKSGDANGSGQGYGIEMYSSETSNGNYVAFTSSSTPLSGFRLLHTASGIAGSDVFSLENWGANLPVWTAKFDGKFGIGTTSPGSRLSVEGDQFIAGNITSTSSRASIFPFASTTAISATNASTTNLIVSSAGGTAGCATFSTIGLLTNTGVACGSGSGTFSFTPTTFGGLSANSTSTLIGFTNGIYSLASSTIGNGLLGGGLHISGGATTTGDLLLQGNNRYLSFGTSTGLLGYGFRDYNGVIQIKNANGSWIDISTTTGSGFGAWESKTVGSIYQAPSDGFAVAYLTVESGDRCSISGYSDSASNPTVVRATAAVADDGSGNRSTTNSMTMPVRKGEYWETILTTDTGNCTGNATLFWIPDSGGDGIWETNGTSAYYSGGKVGIGTSTPWAKLSVSANNGDANLRIFEVSSSTASATTSLFTILNNGSVGIGTTSPSSALSIQGNQFIAGNITSTSTLASVFPYASTTALTVSGLASSTNLVVSSAGGTAGCATFSSIGLLTNTGVACGSGSGASPFTFGSVFGTTSAATTSSIWTQGVFFSSSTVAASQFPYASTTGLTATNLFATSFLGTNATTTSLGITGLTSALLTTDAAGNVVGTTSLSLAFGGTGTSSLTGAASNLQFKYGTSTAIARTYQSKFEDVLSSYDFGVAGNGFTDDTTALQNAINECVSSGKTLYLGPGHFKISSQLNMYGHCAIVGSGWDNTSIIVSSSTANGVVINSENGASIAGLQITGSTTPSFTSAATAGALIVVTGPDGGNQNQIYTLRDLRLIYGFTSVDFDAAQVWTIDNIYALANPTTGVGIMVDNTEFPGNGELQISNSLIQGGDAATSWGGSGILHRSGVNLKIVNSEIFGWVNGYNLTLNNATAMAGTYITNSVFSQVENAITLNKGTGTQYNLVSISNNQIIARNPIATDGNAGWLYDINITGNFIGVGQGSPVSGSTGTGISIPAVDTFTIVGNIIQGASGNGSIVIGSSAANGYIAGNQLRGSLNAVSNSSATTLVQNYTSNVLAFSGASSGYQFDNGIAIGTSTPLSKMHILHNSTYNAAAAALTLGNASNPAEQLYGGFDTNVNAGFFQALEQGVNWRALSLNPNGGNVGIGTTTPDYKLTVNGSASTSLLYGSGLATCQGGNMLTWSNGLFGCEDDTSGGSGTFSFTPTTFGSIAANSTSTLIGFTQGLYALASSTLQDVTMQNSTTTGRAYFAGLFGIGTTSPAKTFSVAGNGFFGGTSGTTTIEHNAEVLGTLKIGTGSIYLQGNATSSYGAGINLATGCFAVNNVCVGSAASNSGVVLSEVYVGTTSRTWSKPSNLAYVVVELWGGGGGGGGGNTDAGQGTCTDGSRPGGGGGYMIKRFPEASLSGTTSVRVTVGAGGTAGTTGCHSAAGGNGGASDFGGMATSTGGTGGGGTLAKTYGVGGIGQGGDANLAGESGTLVNGAYIGGNGARGGMGGRTNAISGGVPEAGHEFGGGGLPGFNASGGSQTNGSAGGVGGYTLYVYTTTGLSVGSVGAGTQGQFAFYNASGQDLTATSSLYVSQTGNIGIGTTSPYRKLSVVGDAVFTGGNVLASYFTATSTLVASTFSYASTTAITATTASTTNLILSSAGGTGTRCVQVDADGTISASASACGTGSGSTAFTFASTFGTTTAAATSSIWTQGVFFSSSTVSASQFPYASTTAISASGSAYFAISGGNVGIGTTSPSQKLEVNGNAKIKGTVFSTDGSANGGTFALGESAASVLSGNPTGTLLSINAAGYTNVSINGNIGIGTSTPISALNVYGDTLFNGTNRYANFGTTTGTLGYGFRDNAGTLEFKNQNGSWQGVTTATSGPSFRVSLSGNLAYSQSTFTPVNWSSETVDTNNNFDLSSDRFTPTVPGKYMVTVNLTSNNAVSGVFSALLKKNGSTIQQTYSGANAQSTTVSISTIVDMNGTSDYLTVEVYDDNASPVLYATGSVFSGALIAPVSATAGGWTNDGIASYLVDTSDYVGIGTTSPYRKLSVVGDAVFSGGNVLASYFTATSTTNASVFPYASSTAQTISNLFGTNAMIFGSTTIGNGTQTGGLTISGGATTTGKMVARGDIDFNNGSAYLTMAGDTLQSFAAVSNMYTNGANTLAIQYGFQLPTAIQGYNDGVYPLLLQKTGGNVGIGTSTPLANLSVQKNYGSTNANIFSVSSSTASAGSTQTDFLTVSGTGFGTTTLSGLNVNGSATSTSNVGFNISTGCYAINSVCITGGGSASFGYLFPNNSTTTLINFNGGLTGRTASFGATGTSTFTTAGFLGIGTTTPWAQLSVNSPTSEPLFISGSGNVIPNLESAPLNVRYSNRIFPQAVGGASESTGLYFKVDPTGTNNQLFGIYGELTSEQQDTEAGLIKTIHYGAGDAIYNAIFSTGIGVESAIFSNGGRGFLGSIQADAATSSVVNSIPFVSLWATSTIPGYGGFFASESPARGLTIQKYATSAPDGYEQIRLTEPDLGRNRFAVYNSGSTILSSLTATSGTPRRDSPDLILQGQNFYYGGSNSDMNAIIRNVVTGTSSPEFRFLLGTSSQETIAAVLRRNQLDMQSNNLVGVGGLTYSNGSVLTLTSSAALNQNLQTVDIPTFAGLITTASSSFQNVSMQNSTTTGRAYFAGLFGIGTTSNALGAKFAVGGNVFIGDGTSSTSTVNNNLDVLGFLKVGTSSIFLNGNGTSTFSGGITTNYLNITGTVATSTFSSGLNLSGGCFSINGTCISGSGSGSGIFSFTPTTFGGITANSTSTLIGFTNGIYAFASSTIGGGTQDSGLHISGGATTTGDLLLQGTSRYLGFGTSTGTLGYGFRDNNGVMEFKNQNGSWQGVTTATSGPSFRVHRNGSSQTVSQGIGTMVDWTTEDFDTNNNFNLSTDRFTPTVPGKYMITAGVYCSDATTYCQVRIYKNGGVVSNSFDIAGGSQATVSDIIDMNGSTDYIEINGLNSGGTTFSGQADATYAAGALIAPVSATAGGWTNDNTQSYLIDSTDKVGVGTTTPWSKLGIQHNYGESLTSLFSVASSTSSTGSTAATFFTVTNSGNIGIGTTSPGTFYGSNVNLGISGAGLVSQVVKTTTTGSTNAATLYLDRGDSSNGYAGVTFATAGTPNWTLNVPAGTSDLRLYNQAGVSELMRFTTGGNVGIGTTAPGNALHIASTSAGQLTSALLLQNRSSTLGTSVGLNFITSATDFTDQRYNSIRSINTDGSNGSALTFNLSNGAAPSEAMRITQTARVGIGTTTPLSHLHVAGATPKITLSDTEASANAKHWFAQSTAGTFQIGTTSDALVDSSAMPFRILSTGQVVFQQGTAAVPAFAFGAVGALGQNGLFVPAANNLGFSTGAAERMRIDSSGNLGVGTTTPAQLASVGGSLFVGASSGGGTSGGLGVGVVNTSAGSVVATGNISSTGGNLAFGGLNNGISTNGNTGWGFRITNASSKFYTDLVGAWGSNSGGGARFVRNGSVGGSNDGTPVMIVDYDGTGRVGIGTTTPNSLLTLYADASAKELTLGAWSGSSSYNAIYLNGLTGTAGSYNFISSNADQHLYINRPTNGDINFRENNGSSQMIIKATTGNVGIGTTTPTAKLTINGNSTFGNLPQIFLTGSSNPNQQLYMGYDTSSNFGYIQPLIAGTAYQNLVLNGLGGNVGIGTTSPTRKLSVADSTHTYLGIDSSAGTQSGTIFSVAGVQKGYIGTDSSGNTGLVLAYGSSNGIVIDSSGNVLLNNASILAQSKATIAGSLYSNQLLGFRDTGDNTAGNYVYFSDSANNIVGSISRSGASNVAYNTSSDRRIKENISTTTQGLDALMQLPVRDFSFIIDESHATTTGFIAQELRAVFPWAVSTNGDDGFVTLGTSTPWAVDYGRVTPLLAKSIQDLNLKLEDLATTTPPAQLEQNSFAGRFFARIIAWFADASNGIQKFFAKEVHTDQICVKKSDGTEFCANGDTLEAMLAGSAAASTPPPAPSPTPTSTPSSATLTIQGNNPAEWPMSAPWTDNLGALFTNSGQSETIYSTSTVDTSLSSTTTIDYWAVVPSTGDTLHATREVVVVDDAPTPSPEPEPVPETPEETPQEPTASSTPPISDVPTETGTSTIP